MAVPGLSSHFGASLRLLSAYFLKEFFENPAFRSDGLKLYPTLVIRGTGQLNFPSTVPA